MDENFKDAVRLAVTTLQDRANNFDVQVSRLDTRIDDVTKSLHAALSVIGDLANKLEEADRKIDRLERDVSHLENSTIASLERDVYSLEMNVSNLETDVRNHSH